MKTLARKIEIIVGEQSFPCYPTLGSMLRFKQETGREVTQIDSESVSDLAIYLWCCTVSASKREGKDFTLSLQDFADNVDPDALSRWNDAVTAQLPAGSATEPGEEKKR